MSVEIRTVENRRDRKRFVYLPEDIHRDHHGWVPPIYSSDATRLNPARNRCFSHCDVTMALAERLGKTVGRVAGIINHRYNEARGVLVARFGYIECRDDPEVAQALLRHVESWAKSRGMNRVIGPLGFTNQDPVGLQIEGFEHIPALSMTNNFQFLPKLVEDHGYDKDVDYVVYRMPLPAGLPDRYQRIREAVLRSGRYRLLEFHTRKELRRISVPILELMNECYQDVYGNSRLDSEELIDLAKEFLPILNPSFVKVVMLDEEIVAFLIAAPNMSEGIRAARGRLWPFGVFHMRTAARRTKQLDLLIGAIAGASTDAGAQRSPWEGHRGRGLDLLLGAALMESARSAGFEYMDSSRVLETNDRSKREMELMGGSVYKRYRVYGKPL